MLLKKRTKTTTIVVTQTIVKDIIEAFYITIHKNYSLITNKKCHSIITQMFYNMEVTRNYTKGIQRIITIIEK